MWLSWLGIIPQSDSQLGHIPRLRVQSLVGVDVGSNLLMFLSHINVSFPFSSLPLLLKINK